MSNQLDFIVTFEDNVIPKLSASARMAVLEWRKTGNDQLESIYRRAVATLRVWKAPSSIGALSLLLDDEAAKFYGSLSDEDGEIEIPDL